MKQNEKTKLTCDKIIQAAIAEFGTKSYESASLNTICSENQISKGLIYHNFKNKDELYLKCLKICFQRITAYLRSAQYMAEDIRISMKNFLALRQKFFLENPHYSNIFFNAVLQPPKHLMKEIRDIRHEFDDYNASCYQKMLTQIQLREGITDEMALEYFTVFQEMFNGYYQSKAYEIGDFHNWVESRETNLSKILDIMLYGIAKENTL